LAGNIIVSDICDCAVIMCRLWTLSCTMHFLSGVICCLDIVTMETLHLLPVSWLNVDYLTVKLSLTLWCPLLPYGYSYKASCARPD